MYLGGCSTIIFSIEKCRVSGPDPDPHWIRNFGAPGSGSAFLEPLDLDLDLDPDPPFDPDPKFFFRFSDVNKH